jgi:hypothetical protein
MRGSENIALLLVILRDIPTEANHEFQVARGLQKAIEADKVGNASGCTKE